jgi:alcohol dehydrogenase (cytochrome c)
MILLATLATPALAFSIDDADWETFNRDLEGTRHSPLSDIDTANVGRLRRVASFETRVQTSFQCGPIVVDGKLYCTTFKHTYAIDAVTGRLQWKDVADLKLSGLGSHRGVAYDNGRIFRGYSHGWVVGFDADTGKRIWAVNVANPTKGESIPMAPIAWNDLVFVGNAGGDNYAVTGRIYGLDAKTGNKVWQFDTVPSSGPARDTWENKSLLPAGAATWTTYSLDPDKGVLYICAGNPAPDFAIGLRPGRNLYSNCLIALDARTGDMLAWIQPTRDDFHDWDLSAAPALISTRGGNRLAALGGKDGFLYGIDIRGVDTSLRENAGVMRILYQTSVTRRFNTQQRFNTRTFVRFAPGSQGGVEWNGPAFDPASNLVLTPAIDWAVAVKLAPAAELVDKKPGDAWSGAHDGGFGRLDPPSKWGGYLTATDADSGKKAWSYRSPTPVVAAVTTTAGGIVFAADLNGYVRAFNTRTGQHLWKDLVGRPIGGGIVTYEVGNKQYVAVAAGMTSPIWPTKKSTAEIVIYALP